MDPAKYYSIDDAIKMLPYIKAYCRDIIKIYTTIESLTRKNKHLANQTSIDTKKLDRIKALREEIRQKIEIKGNTYYRWKKELRKMYITICSARFGRVDVPVYCPAMESIVMLCVTPDTTGDNIEWHVEGETHEECRPYFDKVY